MSRGYGLRAYALQLEFRDQGLWWGSGFRVRGFRVQEV